MVIQLWGSKIESGAVWHIQGDGDWTTVVPIVTYFQYKFYTCRNIYVEKALAGIRIYQICLFEYTQR